MAVESIAGVRAGRPQRRRLDLSQPVMVSFALLLCVLIVLPIGWIIVYSVSDGRGALTLANFARLFTDPAYLDPLLTTLTIAVCVGIACCLVAAPVG